MQGEGRRDGSRRIQQNPPQRRILSQSDTVSYQETVFFSFLKRYTFSEGKRCQRSLNFFFNYIIKFIQSQGDSIKFFVIFVNSLRVLMEKTHKKLSEMHAC
jgi:hypothetical protein